MRCFVALILALSLSLSCSPGRPPSLAGGGHQLSVAVPSGPPPVLDGALGDAEWQGALRVSLSNDGTLRLLRHANKLYLGIHYNTKYGSTTVAQARGDNIKICQWSHLQASASYVREGRHWRRSRDFNWVRINRGDEPGIADHLSRVGWVAVAGLPGLGRVVEYCITVPPEGLQLALVKNVWRGTGSPPHWPPGLRDGLLDLLLTGEQAPEFMDFKPDTWARIVFAPPEIQVPTPPKPPRLTNNPALEGAWRVTEIRYVWEGGAAPNPEPLPGRFLFTDGHYSMVWHHRFKPQPYYETPWRPTDEERVASYNAIVVNSGDYELREDTLITRPAVAKTVEFEGGEARWIWEAIADTLWLESAEIWNYKGEMDPGVGEMTTEIRCERIRWGRARL